MSIRIVPKDQLGKQSEKGSRGGKSPAVTFR
ncbi:formate dehydrogenase accessory protein FdhE [Yersinia rohdei]|uniref:Formate dehydrogenase accessory protein FdhE n=1 Tax=Yersinia rohdei TaxID=29485 RepID=A0A0U1HQ16_YERRO|nr:formate dehydrogenase accessory protein FdhE [Yersinia rohdei]